MAVTAAPARGAYPRPPLDPKETIIPPLGSWFWFISLSTVKMLFGSPISNLIPLKDMLDIPETVSSVILKLLFGLLTVVGVWNIPLMNTIPFPPVVPIPVVFAPPTVKVNVLPIPVNSFEISSNIWFVL